MCRESSVYALTRGEESKGVAAALAVACYRDLGNPRLGARVDDGPGDDGVLGGGVVAAEEGPHVDVGEVDVG